MKNLRLRYIESPTFCMECGGNKLIGEEFEVSNDTQVFRRVRCDNCGYMWKDFYTLTDVVIEGEGKECR